MDAKEKEVIEKAEAEAKTKAEADKAKEDGDKPEGNRLVDDVNLAAKRLEEATEAARKERVEAERSYGEMKLGGTAAGHIETKEVSEEDKKTNQAQEFFKGTALGDAIKKANKDE